MFKKMSLILTVVLVATVLVACGPSDIDTTPTARATSVAKPTEGMKETAKAPTAKATESMKAAPTMKATEASNMTAEPTKESGTSMPGGQASITVKDQPVKDNTITVEEVVSKGPGWVVVHLDNNGKEGDVVGFAKVMDGKNTNVKIELDKSAVLTDMLIVELHQDTGKMGTFEFKDDPKLDPPLMVDGKPVMATFKVTKS